MSYSRPALLRPASLQKRLWQGALAMSLLIFAIASANRLSPRDGSLEPQMLGHDFLPFYTAGTLVRAGMYDLLYDLGTLREMERETAARYAVPIGKSFGPFWNPPFYAWLFAPFAAMPYPHALASWTLLNVAALLVAMLLLTRMLGDTADWSAKALVPLLMLVSMPFIQAISHGQNTFGSLMLVAMMVTAWRAGRGLAAGVACGLLLYKPQLCAVLGIMLVLDMGWRALAGLALTCAALVGVTILSMPRALALFVEQLPANLHYMQIESTYLWERHATLRAFWRLLLQGRGPGEATWATSILAAGSALLVFGGLLYAVVHLKRRSASPASALGTGDTPATRRDLLIAATIAATPLIMPFYFDYDLLLLAVPAVLLASELNARKSGSEIAKHDRWLVRMFMLLFLWLNINPTLAQHTRLNGTVALLSCVAGMLVIRAARSPELSEQAAQESVELAITRAAA
ncbi:MAG: glycosyltransferase family 87 protein [Tepidisphaeraceae bacterium]